MGPEEATYGDLPFSYGSRVCCWGGGGVLSLFLPPLIYTHKGCATVSGMKRE